MLKIRRPLGRLIFNMGIAIPGKTVFLIETAPCMPHKWTNSCYYNILLELYEYLRYVIRVAWNRQVKTSDDHVEVLFVVTFVLYRYNECTSMIYSHVNFPE